MIRVYTAPGCHHCESVIGYLRSKGQSYIQIDTSKDKEGAAFIIKAGGSVPVTVIGHDIIVGFNRAAIDKALGT